MTLSTEDLLALAHTVTGHPVRWHRGGPKGAWLPQGSRISVRYGMSDAQTRSTLAHEIIHALHRDPAGHVAATERRTDREAAHLLVTRREYLRAEQIYGTDEDRVAEELGVTRHLVRVWKASVDQNMSATVCRPMTASTESPTKRIER